MGEASMERDYEAESRRDMQGLILAAGLQHFMLCNVHSNI